MRIYPNGMILNVKGMVPLAALPLVVLHSESSTYFCGFSMHSIQLCGHACGALNKTAACCICRTEANRICNICISRSM